MIEPLFSVEPYSFGISGLDTTILSVVVPEEGVFLAPVDPWFIFSPLVLPSISTEWVRQYNLPTSKLHWYYWLPFDPPFDVFEWFPKWDNTGRRFMSLTASGYPVRARASSLPDWVFTAQRLCSKYYLDHVPKNALPAGIRDIVSIPANRL